jgi:hypothetical protein
MAKNIKNKEVTSNPTPLLVTSGGIRSLKGAKRLQSKLISEFIAGNIEDRKARTLCYLITTYINIIRDIEFEDRLKNIEQTVNEKI